MMPVRATLLYILKGGKILLVYKKRGHGEGKWNGIGGKIEDGELPESCAAREAKEEVGIDVGKMELRGIIYFYNVYGRDWDVFVYSSEDYDGEIRESEEVLPKWFNFEDVPYDEMWEDDKEWLPVLIRGDYFLADYHFDGDKLINSNLRIVPHDALDEEYQNLLKDLNI